MSEITERAWGHYTVIGEGPRNKVKYLVVNPGMGTSIQRHHHRAEQWTVVRGMALVHGEDGVSGSFVKEGDSHFVAVCQWHRLFNPGRIPLIVVEVQIGEYLEEDDIERKPEVAAING